MITILISTRNRAQGILHAKQVLCSCAISLPPQHRCELKAEMRFKGGVSNYLLHPHQLPHNRGRTTLRYDVCLQQEVLWSGNGRHDGASTSHWGARICGLWLLQRKEFTNHAFLWARKTWNISTPFGGISFLLCQIQYKTSFLPPNCEIWLLLYFASFIFLHYLLPGFLGKCKLLYCSYALCVALIMLFCTFDFI